MCLTRFLPRTRINSLFYSKLLSSWLLAVSSAPLSCAATRGKLHVQLRIHLVQVNIFTSINLIYLRIYVYIDKKSYKYTTCQFIITCFSYKVLLLPFIMHSISKTLRLGYIIYILKIKYCILKSIDLQ